MSRAACFSHATIYALLMQLEVTPSLEVSRLGTLLKLRCSAPQLSESFKELVRYLYYVYKSLDRGPMHWLCVAALDEDASN